MPLIEPLGPKIRKQRRRLGLTLDDLAGRTGISKPYLSIIETSRVPNPPSDEKLRRLEQTLGFAAGELLTYAHLQRTPRDVRAMLGRLLSQAKATSGENPPGIDLNSDYVASILRDLLDIDRANVQTVAANTAPPINRHQKVDDG